MQEFWWQTEDQLRLYGRHWPAEDAVAVVALVHGLGEHCARYDPMAAHFNTQHIAVVGSDRRGHGRSEGKRGHTTGLKAFLNEIDSLLQHARQWYPDLPIFLYGHSMGGNLVLTYGLERSAGLQGLIASAPWIKLVNEPPKVLMAAVRWIHKMFPAYTQGNSLDPQHICTDPEEVKKYVEDPLVHDRISAATALAMVATAEKLQNTEREAPLPILIMHGGADPIVSVEGSTLMKAQLRGPVELSIWKGMFHEIHHEPQRQQVFDAALEWIKRQLAHRKEKLTGKAK